MTRGAQRAAEYAVILLALLGCAVLAHSAYGQTLTASDVTPTQQYARPESPVPAILLAQVCWLEATWRHDDCAAIVYVLAARAERAGRSVESMARAYSAIERGTPRAKLAKALPKWLDAKAWRKWESLYRVADDALSRLDPNPCPGARHWGARNLPRDVRRALNAIEAGRWRVVQCRTRTANAFYTEVRS